MRENEAQLPLSQTKEQRPPQSAAHKGQNHPNNNHIIEFILRGQFQSKTTDLGEKINKLSGLGNKYANTERFVKCLEIFHSDLPVWTHNNSEVDPCRIEKRIQEMCWIKMILE